MTHLLHISFATEGKTTIMVGRSIEATDSFAESMQPMEFTPVLEFFGIIFVGEVNGFGKRLVGLSADRLHHLSLLFAITKSIIQQM